MAKLDPLAFLLQDGSIPKFNREINDNVICYEPLNQFLDSLSHKDPGLKKLEIGAGTGARTDHILEWTRRRGRAHPGLYSVCLNQYFSSLSRVGSY